MLAAQQILRHRFALVQREATVVTLVRAFQSLGVLMPNLIPLTALTKRPPQNQAAPIGHRVHRFAETDAPAFGVPLEELWIHKGTLKS